MYTEYIKNRPRRLGDNKEETSQARHQMAQEKKDVAAPRFYVSSYSRIQLASQFRNASRGSMATLRWLQFGEYLVHTSSVLLPNNYVIPYQTILNFKT